MSYLTKVEFANLKKVKLPQVTRWIKEGKLEVVILEDGKEYIKYDIRDDLTEDNKEVEILDNKIVNEDFKSNNLKFENVLNVLNKIPENLEKMERSLLTEFKEQIISMIDNSLTTELKEENKELKEEIKQLRTKIENMQADEIDRLRKDKGFFKKLFGG